MNNFKIYLFSPLHHLCPRCSNRSDLSAMELNFDALFKPTVIAMRLSLSHPSIVRNKKWLLQYIVLHGLAILYATLLLYSLCCAIKENDFSAASRAGCFCVLFINYASLYCFALVYRETIIKIMNTINKNYERAKNVPVDTEITSFYAKRGSSVCKQWTTMNIIGVFNWIILNVLLYTLQYYKGYDFHFIPIYEFKYLEFLEEHKNNLVIYLMMYCVTLYFYTYSAIACIAFMPLGAIFKLHACGQLELIKKRIENLFLEPSSGVQIEIELRYIVDQLQSVYR